MQLKDIFKKQDRTPIQTNSFEDWVKVCHTKYPNQDCTIKHQQDDLFNSPNDVDPKQPASAIITNSIDNSQSIIGTWDGTTGSTTNPSHHNFNLLKSLFNKQK